jgi:hypothetical protein
LKAKALRKADRPVNFGIEIGLGAGIVIVKKNQKARMILNFDFAEARTAKPRRQ